MAVDRSMGGVGEPAASAFAITPSDDGLSYVTRAIYVGGTGTLVVTMLNGEVVTFSAVPVGTVLPIRVTKVAAASTATLLVGLY